MEKLKRLPSVTKESLFNDLSDRFPKAMPIFQKFIDEWKSVNDTKFWTSGELGETGCLKYHDYPRAMQIGIWFEFVQTYFCGRKCFTHVGYLTDYEFEQDILSTFEVIERQA
jgi:hypothetical protein